jgi:hypothetical protein
MQDGIYYFKRGIRFEEPDNENELPSEKSSKVKGITPCTRCGGKARLGMLFDKKEIIIVFSDNDEKRFLEICACRQCGNVNVTVDFETEVERYGRDIKTNGSEAKYRCSHCGWEPDQAEEWYCDKCGCYWNTFQTDGRCPKCNHQWTQTACNNCGEWADHEDWYVETKQGDTPPIYSDTKH